VLRRPAAAADHVNQGLDICAFRLPALEDIVGDRNDHGPTLIAGQAVRTVSNSREAAASAQAGVERMLPMPAVT